MVLPLNGGSVLGIMFGKGFETGTGLSPGGLGRGMGTRLHSNLLFTAM